MAHDPLQDSLPAIAKEQGLLPLLKAAIRQICSLRNDLVHVNFDKLSNRLPDASTMLSWFGRLVEAFEDMNVIIRDTRRHRRRVRQIGRFTKD